MIKILILTISMLLLGFSKPSHSSDTFSALEKKMDDIATNFSRDTSLLLTKMEDLLAKTSNASIEERALFLTYDCSLRARLAPTLAQERFEQLKELSITHNKNSAVRAATALCEASFDTFDQNSEGFHIATYKAFIFAQKAELATLRYWISLNVYSVFDQYKDYHSGEQALLVGLGVAKANNDQIRLSTAHQLLAENYIKLGEFEKAFHHNQQAQIATDNVGDTWYQAQLYHNKALYFLNKKDYPQAISLLNKALKMAQKNQQLKLEQFIKLELAYSYILTNNIKKAEQLAIQVSSYATTYDDTFYNLMHKVTLGYINLRRDVEGQEAFNNIIVALTEKGFIENELEMLKRRVVIAKLTKNSFVANDSMNKYVELLNTTYISNNKKIHSLTNLTFEKIIADDEEIADFKLNNASALELQNAKYNDYLLWIIYLLVALLAFLLVRFFWLLSKKYQLKKEEINKQRYCDPLTGSYNRRYFEDKVVARLLNDSSSKNTSYLIMLDIDHFKSFNDTFGHSAGDVVLTELVRNLQSDSRLQDSVIRMGGEEFLITLPPNDNLRIEVFIERMLKLISQKPVIIEDSPKTITVSIGFAPINNASNKQDIDDIIELADKALYLAKSKGRNQAYGISQLQCPASYIDNIEIANDNKLLTLTQIKNNETHKE